MKHVGAMVLVLLTVSLGGYQPPEQGLFYAYVAVQPAYAQQGPKRVFEQRGDGVTSVVQQINGAQEFTHWVVQASLQKPVLVKVGTKGATQACSLDEDFRNLADQFSDQMGFISIDVQQKHNNVLENYEILCQILVQDDAKDSTLKVQLPFFLLFHNGALQMIPGYAPEGLVKDLKTKEQLQTFVAMVLNRGAGQKQVIVTPGKPDMVPTTGQSTTPADNGQEQPKRSWWQRLTGAGSKK
jgi:hypothetical protein